jgi:GH24 family phage-related lysozyme (muramidase)
MAKSKFQNLNIDVQQLRTMTVQDRLDFLKSREGGSILPNFTPSQLNELFPAFYRRTFNDIGQAFKAVSDRRNVAGGVSSSYAEATSRSARDAAAAGMPAAPAWQRAVQQRYGVDITASGVDDAASLIRRKEGYRSRPYWDVNAWRIGYGSDTITRADGSVIKVTPGMNITREDAERDLQRRIPEFQRQGIIQHVGQNAWDKLNDQTKAAITSLAYNYGSISRLDALKRAIATNDKNVIAQAIESYAGHNNGINYNRRMEEARMIRTSSDTPIAATEIPQLPQGLDPKLVEEYNRMSAYQQRNFHRVLNRMGENNVDAGVNVMNRIYQENPGRVEQFAQRSSTATPVRFTSEEEGLSRDAYGSLGIRLAGGAARRGYISSLQGMDAELMGRYQNALNRLPEDVRNRLRINSAFRDPNDPEIQRMYQQWLAGPRTTPMADPRFSKHGMGKAFDIQLNNLSREERDLVTREFRRSGLRAPVGGEGFSDRHTHVEVDPNYQGEPAAASFRQRLQQEIDSRRAARTPSQATAPALPSITGAPAGATSQETERPQVPAEPSQATAPALPALALGGEVKTEAQQLQSYAINKSRQRRDDMVVAEGAQPLFTMNSEEEMKFNPATGKVSVNPSPQGLKTDPETLLQKLEPPKEAVETQQKEITRDIQDNREKSQQPVILQSPATPANSYDSILDNTLEKMSPSFQRAVARSRFLNSGDSILGGNYDFGAANMS